MTMTAMKRRGAVGLLAMGALAICAGGAAAQVIVLQSKVKGLRTGMMLQNSQKVSIPAGQNVVFVLPSGSTRTVSGPFKGAASQLTKGVARNKGLFDAVQKYVKDGGASRKTVGAVRSAIPSSGFNRGAVPFSWRAIPTTANGDICLERGASLAFARSRKSRAQAMTLVDMKTQQRDTVRFAAGESQAKWPGAVDARVGDYALILANGVTRKFRIRFVSPLPSKDDTLRVLHAQRCNAQFRAWLIGATLASK